MTPSEQPTEPTPFERQIDALDADFRAMFVAPGASRGESLIADLRYISYRAARLAGAAPEKLTSYPQHAAFERQFRAETPLERQNAGARMADDVFSPSGERGRAFDRDEPVGYRERLYGGL